MSRFGPGAADAALRSGINDFLGANSFANFPLNLLIGQLKFPATQNPSSDANTMDDYEEGTWTPVIGGAGGTSGQTYDQQYGRYVKVGKQVWATFFADFANKGTITGSVIASGLPFVAATETGYLVISYIRWSNLANAFVNIVGLLSSGQAVLELRGLTAAGTTLGTALVTGDIQNTTTIAGTFSYFAAD